MQALRTIAEMCELEEMTEVKSAYAGEAQLIRWALSDGAGHTITLRINPDTRLHPFDGLPSGKEHGQRMQIVCVLIDDHEEAIEPEKAKANSTRHKARPKSGGPDIGAGPIPSASNVPVDQERGHKRFNEMPRSQQCALKCGDEAFEKWLRAKEPNSTEDMTTLIYWHLGITSRKQLDTDPEAGARWDAMLTSFDTRSYAR